MRVVRTLPAPHLFDHARVLEMPTPRLCEWNDSVEELEELFPGYDGMARRISRFIRFQVWVLTGYRLVSHRSIGEFGG